MQLPYKIVHRAGGEDFEIMASSLNRALEVAQIQLDAHSTPDQRVGSLRGDGIVKYFHQGVLAGAVEVKELDRNDHYERIGG